MSKDYTYKAPCVHCVFTLWLRSTTTADIICLLSCKKDLLFTDMILWILQRYRGLCMAQGRIQDGAFGANVSPLHLLHIRNKQNRSKLSNRTFTQIILFNRAITHTSLIIKNIHVHVYIIVSAPPLNCSWIHSCGYVHTYVRTLQLS